MPILREHHLEIRVRYQETDGQGRLHHANFLNYFEVARVDMLRASGISYRDLEQTGTMLVVAELQCQYHQAAFFDDLLTVEIHLEEVKGVRIRHRYRVSRGATLLATGHTVVAAVNRDGKVVRLPQWLREMKPVRGDQGGNYDASGDE